MAMVKLKTLAKSVAAAGTAEALSATSKLVRSLSIQADPANTGNIYVGGSDVDSANGIILDAGQSVEIEAPTDAMGNHMDIDMTHIFIDSDTNAEGVRVVYLERN